MRWTLLALAIGMIVVGCGDASEPWQPNVTAVNADGTWLMRNWDCDDSADCPSRVVFGGRGYSLSCVEVKPELIGDVVAVRNEDVDSWGLRSDYGEARAIAGFDLDAAVALGPEGYDCMGEPVATDYWRLASYDTAPGGVEDADLCRILVEPVGLDCP